ncbi:MAG TPA: class I SAM-dependent methyltransferase [Micromonosporaceae bacterium]
MRHNDKPGAFRHAARYDRTSRHLHRFHARVAADVVAAGLPDGSRVLDVGTGPGRVPLAIAAAAPGLRVDGIDLSEEMIDHARRLATDTPTVSFAVDDVANLSYPDDTFDLVVSTLSQHHWADRERAMRELSRVLKPGGQIWIYDIRFALRRAEAAARTADPACQVRRETVRTRRLSLGLVTRLAIKPTG